MPRKVPPISVSADDLAEPAAQSEVHDFLDKFASANRITIHKMNEQTGRYVHRHSTSPDMIGIVEDFLQNRFGGGIYMLKLHSSDGKIIARQTGIEIGDPLESDRPAAKPAEATTTTQSLAIAGRLGPMDLVELMREEINRNHQLMLEMIRNRDTGGGQSVGELVQAVANLKTLVPEPAQPARTEEIFLKGLEFARKVSGTPANEPDSLMGTIREIFEMAKPLILSGLAGGKAAATPVGPAAPGGPIPPGAPAETLAGDEDNMEVDIEPALAYLKVKFAQGTRTDVLAEIIVDQMQGNDDYTQLLLHVVNQPVEAFLALDDDFGIEPFKTKASELHAELKRRLIPAPAAGGIATA